MDKWISSAAISLTLAYLTVFFFPQCAIIPNFRQAQQQFPLIRLNRVHNRLKKLQSAARSFSLSLKMNALCWCCYCCCCSAEANLLSLTLFARLLIYVHIFIVYIDDQHIFPFVNFTGNWVDRNYMDRWTKRGLTYYIMKARSKFTVDLELEYIWIYDLAKTSLGSDEFSSKLMQTECKLCTYLYINASAVFTQVAIWHREFWKREISRINENCHERIRDKYI